MSVRKCPSANVRPQVSVRKCLSANVRPQMSVRKCPSANVCPQMSVRKCPSASVRPQMSVRKCPSANAPPALGPTPSGVRPARTTNDISSTPRVTCHGAAGKQSALNLQRCRFSAAADRIAVLYRARTDGMGIISICYLMCFTILKAIECKFNFDFFDPTSEHSLFHLEIARPQRHFGTRIFFHNAILRILRNQNNPEHNSRDLLVGYALSAFCTFSSHWRYAQCRRSCLSALPNAYRPPSAHVPHPCPVQLLPFSPHLLPLAFSTSF
ncbi:hypothetical protein niasHT_018068 [Heterodera trifolii]|uniref:Uncharacterized protein n=1 Tax=Heterodera trifolii TaxID=157864 RepID=A0ABD2LL78_9BILA